jgi:hypothetical protein
MPILLWLLLLCLSLRSLAGAPGPQEQFSRGRGNFTDQVARPFRY